VNGLTNDRVIGSRGTEKPVPGCNPANWCFNQFGLDSTWLGIAGVVGQPSIHWLQRRRLRLLNSVRAWVILGVGRPSWARPFRLT